MVLPSVPLASARHRSSLSGLAGLRGILPWITGLLLLASLALILRMGSDYSLDGLGVELLLHQPSGAMASAAGADQRPHPQPTQDGYQLDGSVVVEQAAEEDRNSPVAVVAHVVSLVSCKPGNTQKFLDALVLLRHAIHQTSIHASSEATNSSDGRTGHPHHSKYSYQMYALVHKVGCPDPQLPPFLRRLGYTPLLVDTPVELDDIQGDGWYKSHVEGEKCCGIKEFIKLHAYSLTEHPAYVHWDLDAVPLTHMDDLYDALLHGPETAVGREARSRLQVQRHFRHRPLPNVIDAFFTRDVTSAAPWEKVQAVQGGFVVAKPNMQHLEMYKELIVSGNYTPGRGPNSGWGGLGYGGFQGAMAYQGALAYFYDQLHPGHHVELDVCRWNQVVADVVWRGPDKPEHLHQCRDYPKDDGNFTSNTLENGKCEDCRVLPIEETRTVHFTACKKPWECLIPTPRVPGPGRKAHTYRLQELTNVTTCGLLFRKYFEYRQDVERRISAAVAAAAASPLTPARAAPPEGGFYPEYFLGYCNRHGGYRTMDPLPDGFDMKQVYGF